MDNRYRAPAKAKTYWIMEGTIMLLTVGGIILLLKIFAFSYLGRFEWIANIVAILILIFIVLDGYVHPFIKYKNWGYEVNERKIQYFNGVYVKKQTIIPIVRVQHVTMTEGPLSKKFHLVKVNIATANTIHTLDVVPKEQAVHLCEKVNEWIEERVKEEQADDAQ